MLKVMMRKIKTMTREIKKGLSKWMDVVCSWMGKLNIVKISVLPDIIYQFNAVPIKIPACIFVEID